MGKSRDAFRTISEVAEWLDTQAHVLRFWESKFPQIKPVKRAGGRRYYRPQDMMLLGGIKKLLHDDGLTIKGAQKLLREKGVKYVSGLSQSLDGEEPAPNVIDAETIDAVADSVAPATVAPPSVAPPTVAPPSNVQKISEDTVEYLPEDNSLPTEEDYLPEAEAEASELDDLPELSTTPSVSEDERRPQEDDAPLPPPTQDAGPDTAPSSVDDLFSHAQDTPESGAPDGSDEDDLPPPAQDTIPAFMNRVTQQAASDDAPAEEDSPPAPIAQSAEPDVAQDAVDVDLQPSADADADDDADADVDDDMETAAAADTPSEVPDTSSDEDAQDTPPARIEFTREAFLIDLSRANRIAPKDRARAADLFAQLQALRARAEETKSA